MTTERWIGGSGQGLTWGNAFGSEINSLANASFALGNSIVNDSVLDIYADISCAIASLTTVGPNQSVDVYLYPLNQDGTTYGDSIRSVNTSGVTLPGGTYYIGSIYPPIGTQAVDGLMKGLIIPPGTFAFGFINNLGNTTPASGNSIKYRTYNRQVS